MTVIFTSKDSGESPRINAHSRFVGALCFCPALVMPVILYSRHTSETIS